MMAWLKSSHVSLSPSPGSIHTWGRSTMEKPTSRWDYKVCHESPWIHTKNNIARNILIISCIHLLAHNPKSELAPFPLKYRSSGVVLAGWLPFQGSDFQWRRITSKSASLDISFNWLIHTQLPTKLILHRQVQIWREGFCLTLFSPVNFKN